MSRKEKYKKKKSYSTFRTLLLTGTLSITIILPQATYSTYALLQSSSENTQNKLKAAFVFPETIQGLQKEASTLDQNISQIYASTQRVANDIKECFSLEQAQQKLTAVRNSAIIFNDKVLDLQELYETISSYYEKTNSKNTVGRMLLMEMQQQDTNSILEKVFHDVRVYLDAEENLATDNTQLKDELNKAVQSNFRILSYVSNGYTQIAEINQRISRMDFQTLVEIAEANVDIVEERIQQEEQRRKDQEEKKRKEEEKKRQSEAEEKNQYEHKEEPSTSNSNTDISLPSSPLGEIGGS